MSSKISINGEKIKDGSILLSALGDDVKDKLNKIFIMPEDFIEEEYNEPDEDGSLGKIKQVYVTDILENRYNKIKVDGILGDINILDGLINITAKSEVFQSEQKRDSWKRDSYIEVFIRVQDCKFKQLAYLNKSPFVTLTDAANINGDIRYNFVKSVTNSEITIPEENKQLFKKNMGSFANWNAQEGEAGYIENKPFGEIFKEVEWYLEEYGSYYYCVEVSNQIKIDGIVYDISEDVININGNGFMVAEDGIRVYGVDEDYLKSVLVKIETKMDEKYLPNTVLKTTPQTLENTAKNQALANLGIDPVVMKYLANPFIIRIEDGDCYVPEELVGSPVISAGVPEIKYEWKYLNPAMYIGYDGMTMNYDTVTLYEGEVLTLTCLDREIYIGENFKIFYL